MYRHLFYGQVSVGQWREFCQQWEKLDQTIEDELWETAFQIA